MRVLFSLTVVMFAHASMGFLARSDNNLAAGIGKGVALQRDIDSFGRNAAIQPLDHRERQPCVGPHY